MSYNVQMFPTWPPRIVVEPSVREYAALRSRATIAWGHVGRSERSERSRKHTCYVMLSHASRVSQVLAPETPLEIRRVETGSTRESIIVHVHLHQSAPSRASTASTIAFGAWKGSMCVAPGTRIVRIEGKASTRVL